MKKPTLTFSTYAFLKMTYIARLADTEVGFWCLGRKDDPLYVEDINVIGQEANITLNKFDDDALAEYMGTMHSQGYDLDEFALIWGHTHPKGCGPSPSQTDESTFNGQTQFGGKAKLVMFIVSQSGGMYARLRITDPLLGRVETEMNIEIDFETESVDDFAKRAAECQDMSGVWASSLELVAPLKPVYANTWTYGSKGKIKSILPPAPARTSTSFGKDPGEVGDPWEDDDLSSEPLWSSSDKTYYDKQEEYLAHRDDPLGLPEPKVIFGDEEDAYDMEYFYSLICTRTTEVKGGDNVDGLMTDEECVGKFGCSAVDLEDIYLEVSAEIGEMGAYTLLGMCAEKGVSLKPWIGATDFVLSEIMKALGIDVRIGLLEEEAFILYLEANGNTLAASDIRSECTWVN